ncbi:thiamine pyrophosphate-binding protein [Epibacterium sp. MM17-32]|uniref:thiamine pyrophosphate-binding protein n=1 Tax=Epibacterium sp. MM17-32 TaxID=2917734 RepID=UPI001EF42941|nr:thiamine pyrophosphate-binding protein [Epibacterium sp. MM17-32]MCG7627498.1 thiamine pyrophosphate-binding protein [Epibacterium sp. MM17-32]
MSSVSAPSTTPPRRSGGRILADQLRILGADTIYCVPGESYLELLDGLHAHQEAINVVTCRHESGASNMADAYGKLTGKPGICAVTRGPGATNASNGVHTAFQDSTPMILLIGQVGREMVDREAFQEIDYRRMFGQMAKWVAQIDDAARIPEYMARAWKTALSGRPGPVVLALPEDMLTDEVAVADLRATQPARPAPTAGDVETLQAMIARAERPMLMVGGPGWSDRCAQKALAFAERIGLPVTTSFRSQDYVDNGHDNYVGPVGIAPIPNLRKRLREDVDLLIAVGPRLGEMTTQGYELIDIPHPQMTFVHVHPGAEELGQVYQADLAIQSDPELFFDAAEAITVPDGPYVWADWLQDQRADYLAFQTPTEVPGDVNMGHVVRHMSETLPQDTIFTNGAGNYTVWLHRFHQHRAYRTQLAPTSGSMGYGVPAAVAAKLQHPDRTVVAMAGDGCFMMTSQELATAVQHGADVIFVVVNNGMYGTIRMHQERHHPGKVMATKLVNPDFVAYAASFGIAGERVLSTSDFSAALERARTARGGYMIEIVVDPEALTPNQSLSAVRAEGEATQKA